MMPDTAAEYRSGIVVFARSDSRRLPGKVLRLLQGRPMLAWTLVRLQRSRIADKVILATTDRLCDDGVAALGAEVSVPVVRGSCENVLGRAAQALREHDLDVLVRVSGDSPFIDSALVDELLARQAETGADLVTNVYPHRRLVPGLSVEVLTKSGLVWAEAAAESDGDREHVTAHIYRKAKSGACPLTIIPAGPELKVPGAMTLAVDTEQDFAAAAALARSFGRDLETAPWRDILDAFHAQDPSTKKPVDLSSLQGAAR